MKSTIFAIPLLAGFLSFIILKIRTFDTLLALVGSFANISIIKGKRRAYLLFVTSIISYITISRCF
jgi:hypothetical protein